jgi:hypothetical protein
MKLFTLIVLIGSFFSFPAHAYIDPGMGALILQMIAAVGVGIAFYFRKLKKMLFDMLGLSEKEKKY